MGAMEHDSPIVTRVMPARYFGVVPWRSFRWVVLHTVECSETDAADTAVGGMFARGDRRVSAHYIVGRDDVVQCVREAHVAWAAGHTGNQHGIHIEIVGRAAQTIEQWHDAFSTELLGRAVALVADICTRHSLPIDRVDVEDARAGRWGILDHLTCTQAFRDTDHHDVGGAFPWHEFIPAVRAVALAK